MLHQASRDGTGSKLTKATVIICGVASLVATLISFLWVSIVYTQRNLLLMKSLEIDRQANSFAIPGRYGYRRERLSTS